nr:hypothetical protein [uncultured Allomuricauda sp.]
MIGRLIYLVILLGLGFLVSCKNNSRQKFYTPDSFKNIQISYSTGDEVIRSYAMMIYDSAGFIKTKFTSPISDMSLSERKLAFRTLNEDDLQMVYDFIEKAKKQNDTCSFLSSSLDRYHIKIGIMDSISIFGNCSWDGLDYSTLIKRIYDK